MCKWSVKQGDAPILTYMIEIPHFLEWNIVCPNCSNFKLHFTFLKHDCVILAKFYDKKIVSFVQTICWLLSSETVHRLLILLHVFFFTTIKHSVNMLRKECSYFYPSLNVEIRAYCFCLSVCKSNISSNFYHKLIGTVFVCVFYFPLDNHIQMTWKLLTLRSWLWDPIPKDGQSGDWK